MISRRFLSRFLICSFHLWSLSSWLAAFHFVLEMLFLLLTSFTVCHANHLCPSYTKFLILLIWSWIYFNWTGWVVYNRRDYQSYRAAGVNGISPEIWKHEDLAMCTKLHKLFVCCWEQGKPLQDLHNIVIIPLYKKKRENLYHSN